MSNLFTRFKKLLPDPPLQVGDVVTVGGTTATVEEPGGGRSVARGEATLGDRVYFQDGVIQGPAPDLPIVFVEE